MCQPVLLIVLGASRMILTEGTESKEGVQNFSYLSWDGTGDEKGNTPAPVSDKLVTVKRNRNIDPREQGKFDSGVVSTIVMCQKMLSKGKYQEVPPQKDLLGGPS